MSSSQGGTPTQPQEYQIVLLQPSEKDVPEQTLRLHVSREEILNAAFHFQGKAARDYLIEGMEKNYPKIELIIKGKTLKDYLDAMFTGGRWKDDKSANPNAARLITLGKE